MPVKWKPSSHFVPARNSRHRIACFALYRALLKASPKVPLPDDLETAWGYKRHPISNVIRKAFLKNRNDTSPRLVYPALQAGYRMLDTLTKASSTETPEHASILAFLNERLAERNHVIAQKERNPPNSKTPKKPSSAPNPNTVPLLVRTTPDPTPENPEPAPSYASAVRPRPSSELPPGKKRKIPVLEMALEYPFLRLGKPQPRSLDRILTSKNKARVRKQEMFRDWNDEESPSNGYAECEEEDHWDALIVGLMQDEIQHDEKSHVWDEGQGMTYTKSLYVHGIMSVIGGLTKDRLDAVARADAMRQIIKDEKALAAREKEQDHLERRQRWEARMLLEHGDGWADVIANQKKQRDEIREALMRLPEPERLAVLKQRRLEKKQRLEQEQQAPVYLK
ncbi:hypothetical protein KJ359_009504 [Pestalotiopsis sp. 9143b]|nr:hypothetical protein KJ359_009504 [Pestalotiopsis sp. 9143b]